MDQPLDDEPVDEEFAALFPELSGDKLREAYRDFRGYIKLMVKIHGRLEGKMSADDEFV